MDEESPHADVMSHAWLDFVGECYPKFLAADDFDANATPEMELFYQRVGAFALTHWLRTWLTLSVRRRTTTGSEATRRGLRAGARGPREGMGRATSHSRAFSSFFSRRSRAHPLHTGSSHPTARQAAAPRARQGQVPGVPQDPQRPNRHSQVVHPQSSRRQGARSFVPPSSPSSYSN